MFMRAAVRPLKAAQRTWAASTSGSRRAFHPAVLPSHISTAAPEFKAKSEAMDALVANLEGKLATVRQGGGAKAAERMRSKGKKLPRERYVAVVCVCFLKVLA